MAFNWTCPICGKTMMICDGRDMSKHQISCEKFAEFSGQIATGKKEVKVQLGDNAFISYEEGK